MKFFLKSKHYFQYKHNYVCNYIINFSHTTRIQLKDDVITDYALIQLYITKGL